VSIYVASLAARSAAALPREGVSRCPVCDLTCLRIVCGESDCGACAALVLIAVTIALIYGRAAHRRVEHALGWFSCLFTAWIVLLESVYIVMGIVMGREHRVRWTADASAMKLSGVGRRHLIEVGLNSFSRKLSVM
jgi:hypothetical protein